jgi:FMN phosphatase YigB (HAD superfamily)
LSTRSAPSQDIASFDVFDTLLVRSIPSREAVFAIVGRNLGSMTTLSSEEFSAARIRGEERAQDTTPREEITLHEIYQALAARGAIRPEDTRRAEAVELDVEASLLRPIALGVRRVEDARASGRRVIFVSDMYLPADFIEAQLKHHGIWRDGDGCYVSSAFGKRKRDRSLYREVIAREGVLASRILHIGDNLVSDGLQARAVGLRAELQPQGRLNRYERILDAHESARCPLNSAMAGAARLARLQLLEDPRSHAGVLDVATGVAAPTLTAFLIWLLSEAKKRHLRRLYFLSRDGQPLAEMCARLVQKLGLAVECRYIYASRQVWCKAATIEPSASNLDWAWVHTVDLSIADLLGRMSIAPAEVTDSLAALGFTGADYARNLALHERRHLRGLVGFPAVRALIRERAVETRELLLDYLRQEGLVGSGDPYGVVDLGWHAKMQDALSVLLNLAGEPSPPWFFFGLENYSDAVDPSLRQAYFYDRPRREGLIDVVPELTSPLEAFCSADHGTLVALARETGGAHVLPVLNQSGPVFAGLQSMRRSFAGFIDHLDVRSVEIFVDQRWAVAKLLRAFWIAPTRHDAEVWGREFRWEDGFGGKATWWPMADSYSLGDLLAAARTGRRPRSNHVLWHEASLALTPSYLAFPLKVILRVRAVLPDRKRR